jgi:hypothetical protein
MRDDSLNAQLASGTLFQQLPPHDPRRGRLTDAVERRRAAPPLFSYIARPSQLIGAMMSKKDNGMVVSIQAMQVPIQKYDLQPDSEGNIQFERWMLHEMEEWDKVHNSRPWPDEEQVTSNTTE